MGIRSQVRALANRALSRVLRAPSAGRILLYHEIADGSQPSQHVPASLFRTQLDALEAAGLSGSSVIRALHAGFPPPAVALSFDDGYVSAGRACLELAARGWSATLFVIPEWVGVRAGILTWRDLAELASVGMEIGAHGLAHESPCGRGVERIARDFARAREEIRQRLGQEVSGLAYPFGFGTADARTAARSAGFVYACTTEPGANSGLLDHFRLRRNEMQSTDADAGLVVGKLSGSDDWMRPIRRLENSWRCRSMPRSVPRNPVA